MFVGRVEKILNGSRNLILGLQEMIEFFYNRGKKINILAHLLEFRLLISVGKLDQGWLILM
jgi:hypothetical protein